MGDVLALELFGAFLRRLKLVNYDNSMASVDLVLSPARMAALQSWEVCWW